MAVDFDPFAARGIAQPYSTYRELRDRAPVHYAPRSSVWCISRFDDVHDVLRRPETFSSRAMFTMLMNGGRDGAPPEGWDATHPIVGLARRGGDDRSGLRHLLGEDGAPHDQLRSVVNRGFTPRRIASWEPRIRELAESCVAGLRDGRPFDLVGDLATPIPVTIIAEMLGVETARQADFKRWSDVLIQGATGRSRADPFQRDIAGVFREMIPYLRRLARERRRAPTGDLVSAIVAEEDGDLGLSDREVVQFVMLLLVAGNETTTNLIGNAVAALLDHPEQLARLAADPSLVPGAIDETLRYDAPIQLVFRNALRDVEIAGTKIPRGGVVALLLGSANRDERRFAAPDVFDLSRTSLSHLAFGFGKHFCLGASLGRLEARIALETLLPELPLLRPVGDRELVDSFLMRGPRRLELRRRGEYALDSLGTSPP